MTTNGHQKLLQQLRADGIVYMFGNPGSSEEGLLDEISRFPDVRYILGLQEAAIAGIADGYAQATGKPAIVQLHSSVGLGNGIGSLYHAYQRHSPLVVIAGEAGLAYDALDPHMGVDLVAMARLVTKYAARVIDPRSLLRLLRRCIKIAATPPRGPVFLAVPQDILDAANDEIVAPTVFPSTRVAPEPALIAAAAAMLRGAKNPIILTGDGIAHAQAQDELVRLAEVLGAGVWGVMASELIMPWDHPLYRGLSGHMFGEASARIVGDADAVLICATEIFPEVFPLMNSPFRADAKIIHIDLDPNEIAKNHPVTLGLVADPKLTMRLLAEAVIDSRTEDEAAAAAAREPSPVSAAFIEACVELGFERTEDFNGPKMEGTGWHHVNIKDDTRHSMEEAYLYPALERGANLTLIDNAPATRLLFQGRRCTGVRIHRDGGSETVAASREVILCAGAIDSPKILMLSGIGPGEGLMQMGIPVLVHAPGVGENFHNHVLIPVICVASKTIPPPRQNMSEAALFYKSEPGWPGPDMQMAFVHGDPNQVASDQPPSVMVMLPGVVRPQSRGWVRLSGPDPLAPPLINPNYLACAADFERLTEGVRLARRLYGSAALRQWVQSEVVPGSAVPDEALGEYVRRGAESYHHQAGSCRMGMDALAVVDARLRVHGIEALRVADASVMPAVPSGNCHAGIVAIAEKAADMIKDDRRAASR